MNKRFSRRDFLRVLSAVPIAVFPSQVTAETKKPWNFLFILADDLGWSDLACYGADLHETPHLDRLAKESMRFQQAYAASPVCTPTRASIMTGKYPARLHMTIWRENTLHPPQTNRKLIPPQALSDLPHKEVTIAEALQAGGYRTAHVGKWHLGAATHYPETQGFDINIGGTLWGAPNTYFYPYRGTEYFGEFRYVPHLEHGKKGEYLTDRLTDEAIHIMEQWRDQPFFIHLAYHSVHSPIEGKPEWVQYYQEKIREGMNHRNANYAAMVRCLDENVGRLLTRLDDLGIADHTVVIFFSDNGGVSSKIRGQFVTTNSPLRSGKGSLYEGGIREPLMVRWPGITKPSSMCDVPVCSIDFYPTILDIAGLPGDAIHNPTVDGISMVPLLRNPESQWQRDTLFFHYPHYYSTTSPVSAVRQGDWKLLEYYEDGHVELYNLTEDIGESNNVAAVYPERVQNMMKSLDAWRKRVNAQLPQPNPKW